MTIGLSAAAALAPEAGAEPDLGGTLMGKVLDADYVDVFGKKVYLPHFEPVQLGSFSIDFSPTKHAVFVTLAGLLAIVLLTLASRSFRNRSAERSSSGFANALEAFVVYFRDEVVRRTIGHGSDGFTPFILSVFFMILFMNLLGLMPYGATATGNLSVTAALAVVSFLAIEISGMRALGFKGYMGTIFYAPPGMGPVGRGLMMLIMTPVEFLGKLTKPFALAIRLFANMTAGGILLYSLVGIIMVFGHLTLGRWGIAGASVTMASAIMLLKIFVAFLQAYIFAMLTAVFIGLIRHH
jgi:F-type H+-transporting ATPase subunit a